MTPVTGHAYFFFIPIAVALGGFIPLGYLFWKAFSVESATLSELVFRWRNCKLLLNTFLLAVGVLAVDFVFAMPVAWLTCRTDLRGKRFFSLLCILPLAIPGYVIAYTLLALGGNNGIVAALFGRSIPRLSGYWGALIALSAYTSPYLFLNLRAALMGLDSSLEESAQSLGYSYLEIFYHIILPQLRPAFYASGLLISLHVLGDFGVVSLMRYETFSYALYAEYMLSFEHASAAWLALMLLAFTGLLLYLEAKLLRGVALYRVGSGLSGSVSSVPLRGGQVPAYLYLTLLISVTVIVPAGTVVLWLFKGATNSVNLFLPMFKGLIGSVSIASPAGLICAILAVPFAYVDVRYPSRFANGLARIAYIIYAVPSLAFALSIIFFVLNTVTFIYKTVFVLIYACVLHFLAEAIGPIRSSLYQVSPHLEEAARSLGYSPLQAFLKSVAPILIRGMRVAALLVFLATMKELPLTFLLSPAGYETLALNVWSYTTEAMFAEAAPYALAILIFSGLFVGALIREEEQIYRLLGGNREEI